ncbi:hypothetical protein CB1_000849050 [Camelus ferus]|nr:hypothetical protein CB1_000849050 [Camelus ferus]
MLLFPTPAHSLIDSCSIEPLALRTLNKRLTLKGTYLRRAAMVEVTSSLVSVEQEGQPLQSLLVATELTCPDDAELTTLSPDKCGRVPASAAFCILTKIFKKNEFAIYGCELLKAGVPLLVSVCGLFTALHSSSLRGVRTCTLTPHISSCGGSLFTLTPSDSSLRERALHVADEF